MSYLTDTNGEFDFCDKIESFEHLKELVKFHMRFFTDQAALKLYTFYTVPGSSVPTPLLSAFMGGCLEKGIDKTWGGTDYILGGIIADAMPNCANSLAAINEWVYDKKVYSLPKMAEILKNDFYGGKDPMLRDVLGSPKFGNKDPRVDDIMKWLLDEVNLSNVKSAFDCWSPTLEGLSSEEINKFKSFDDFKRFEGIGEQTAKNVKNDVKSTAKTEKMSKKKS